MALTEEEAFKLLERYRSHLIQRARFEAAAIAQNAGVVHSRQIRDRLMGLGLLHPDIDERWLGCVFPGGLFEATGETIDVQEASPRCRPGGGGGRPIKIWRLKAGKTIDCPCWDGPDVRAIRAPRGAEPSPEEMRRGLLEFIDLNRDQIHSPDLIKLIGWLVSVWERRRGDDRR